MVWNRFRIASISLLVWFAAGALAEEPNLDFDALPSSAPNKAQVELILHELAGKPAASDEVDRVVVLLAQTARSPLSKVIRLAADPRIVRGLDEVYQRVTGKPATVADRLRWASRGIPLEGFGLEEIRLHAEVEAAGKSIAGDVVDAEGKPVADALVTTWTGRRTTRSDADGKFSFDRFDNIDFDRVIIATKDGQAGRVFSPPLKPVSQPLRIQIAPERKLRISVTNDQAAPVANAGVRVGMTSGRGAADGAYFHQVIGHTDAQGICELSGVAQYYGMRPRAQRPQR